MSKHILQLKLEQIDLKIQHAQEERDAFLQEYYGAIMQKLNVIEAHVLPPEVLVGAILDAVQKYNTKDNIVKKWEGMAHPFFRPKRSVRPVHGVSKANESHTATHDVSNNPAKVEKELVHD